MAKAPLNILVLFWLFLAMRPSTTEETITFGINISYTTTEPECSGSHPTIRLSTRYQLENANYSSWNLVSVYTGNCSSYQELSLVQVNQDPFLSDQYQFGIELTNASSCHCVTIVNATGSFGSNLLSSTKTSNFWCNKNRDDFNQLCASSTSNLIFGSKLVKDDGNYVNPFCPLTHRIPEHLPTNDDDGNSVCPEPINSSLPVSTNTFTTSPLLYFSESSSLVTSSSSSFPTLDDQTSIMATPTTSYPFNYPTMTSLPSSFSVTPNPSTVFFPKQNSTSYSSTSSITPAPLMSQSMSVSMKVYSLATALTPTPVAIYASHMNGGVSQTSAHSSLTSPGASPSPTMLFCSASEDGKWPITRACANATSSDCRNNFLHVNGTRICHCNGTWGMVHCIDIIFLLRELINVSPVDGLMTLRNLPAGNVNNAQRLQLLQMAFTVQSKIGVNTSFVQAALEVFDTLDPIRDDEIDAPANVAFLPLLDKIALSLRRNISINTTNIALVVQEVLPDTGQVQVTLTNDSYISLPEELFRNSDEPVTIASFFFKNISHVLPGRDPISPVISSILSCTNCRTSNLSENVTISFSLPSRMTNNKECVFADLQREDSSDIWNNSGCVAVKYENGSVNCSCSHLTHFAILLSPGVDAISKQHTIALTVTGQVLVSISLVFLLATIFTYVLHKSLWNMRNYIHVMLCANLFAAQLVFVVGVERTENKAVCSAIAVLLHYMFLVVFMWMLMEGVVLYVALVVVFVNHRMRYIAGFTIASYGIPLVYMAVVVPIGLLVNTDDIGNHYGRYNTTSGELLACWLRYDTHFIWAFITPVVLIILINLGLLIRALVVMCKHFRRQKDKSELDTSKHWLKVIVSLTVVMGIAWVGNILFFNINLLFIAYIMTAIIAGQGIIIFILFVPLSKQVRDAYSNLWRVKQAQSEILSKLFPTKGTKLPTSAISTSKSSNGNGNKHEDNIVMGTLSSEKAGSNGSNIHEECKYSKCLVSTHDEIQEKSPKAD